MCFQIPSRIKYIRGQIADKYYFSFIDDVIMAKTLMEDGRKCIFIHEIPELAAGEV